MKTTIEDLSKLEKKLNIEVPASQVDSEFLKAFKYLQKNVEIKGFRKGKAPIDKIRSLYGDKIRSDVTQNLVQATYMDALKEHDLIPIGMPDIQFLGEVGEGETFTYTAQFEVQPDIELSQIEALEVKKEKLDINDEKVDSAMEEIRQSNAKMTDVKLIRELQEGDFALIDFKGFVDDKPLENGAAQDHILEIGSNSFIPGFEEKLVGMKPEENKKIHLSFPEDYHVEDLKGKKVMFDVSLKGIKSKTTPEWNEEFISSLGPYKNKDELREALIKDMTNAEEQRVTSDLRSRMFKELVKVNPFEVPQTLVTEQRNALLNDMRQRLQGQGMSEQDFAEYQIKWHNDFSETAEYMVRSALLIQKIAKEKNLEAEKSDLDKKYQEMSAQTGLPVDKVKSFYQQQGGGNLEFQITEEKVFDLLLETAKVEEVDRSELPDLNPETAEG